MDNPNLSDCSPMDPAGVVNRVGRVIGMCRHVTMSTILAKGHLRARRQ